jgi:hypothetical protein
MDVDHVDAFGTDDFEAVRRHGWSDLYPGAGGDEVGLTYPEVHRAGDQHEGLGVRVSMKPRTFARDVRVDHDDRHAPPVVRPTAEDDVSWPTVPD